MIRVVFAVSLFTTPSFAQQVGFLDLSGQHHKPDAKTEASQDNQTALKSQPNSEPECTNMSVSIADGALISKTPEKLRLKIIKVDRIKYTEGEELIADIRLENVGENPVQIPFSPKGVDFDVKNGERSYFSGGIELELETGDRGDSESNTLFGDASVEGSEKTAGSIIQLKRGESVVIRVKKTLKCDSAEYCKKFETDESALIRAEWTEYLFTRRREGCELKKGAYRIRKLVSKPISVDFVALPHPESVSTSSDSNVKKQ